MKSDYHSELIGDKFVHHLSINFVNKETILILGGHPHEEITFRYVLRFENVVLQDLNGIQPYNIFWGMEVSDQYADFAEQQKDYLLRMYNYFTPRFLEEIQLDTSLKYYFISSTIGLCGFIICRNAVLVKE